MITDWWQVIDSPSVFAETINIATKQSNRPLRKYVLIRQHGLGYPDGFMNLQWLLQMSEEYDRRILTNDTMLQLVFHSFFDTSLSLPWNQGSRRITGEIRHCLAANDG